MPRKKSRNRVERQRRENFARRREAMTHDDRYTVLDMQITHEAMPDPKIAALGEAERARIVDLMEQAWVDPVSKIDELEAAIERYPQIEKLYTHLMAGYNLTGRGDEADLLLSYLHGLFPDYLFARTNLALHLIDRGEPERVPEVFGHALHPRLMYPHRRLFHVSEVAAFFGTLTLYFDAIGDFEKRAQYADLLRVTAPDQPVTHAVLNRIDRGRLLHGIQDMIERVRPRIGRMKKSKRGSSMSGAPENRI